MFTSCQPLQAFIPGTYPGAPPVQLYLCTMGCIVAQPFVATHSQGAHP